MLGNYWPHMIRHFIIFIRGLFWLRCFFFQHPERSFVKIWLVSFCLGDPYDDYLALFQKLLYFISNLLATILFLDQSSKLIFKFFFDLFIKPFTEIGCLGEPLDQILEIVILIDLQFDYSFLYLQVKGKHNLFALHLQYQILLTSFYQIYITQPQLNQSNHHKFQLKFKYLIYVNQQIDYIWTNLLFQRILQLVDRFYYRQRAKLHQQALIYYLFIQNQNQD